MKIATLLFNNWSSLRVLSSRSRLGDLNAKLFILARATVNISHVPMMGFFGPGLQPWTDRILFFQRNYLGHFFYASEVDFGLSACLSKYRAKFTAWVLVLNLFTSICSSIQANSSSSTLALMGVVPSPICYDVFCCHI